SDLGSHSREEVFRLVQKRWEGIALLRRTLGYAALGFELHGGHELFPKDPPTLLEGCMEGMEELNRMLEPIFGERPFGVTDNTFGFEGILPRYITHKFEGQLNTGRMMRALIQKCHSKEI